MTRRSALGGILAGMGAIGAAALAPSSAAAKTAAEIDAGVRAAREELFRAFPDSRRLYERASGVLFMPEVLEAGFVLGGEYGEGALISNGRTDSYWSFASASIGFQAGAQRTRQALFFMTPGAMHLFKTGDGFEVGADAEITVIEGGAGVDIDTTQGTKPIIAMIYGREGLHGGASLQGGKYSRIDP